MVHLGALEVAIQEVPFGGAGAPCARTCAALRCVAPCADAAASRARSAARGARRSAGRQRQLRLDREGALAARAHAHTARCTPVCTLICSHQIADGASILIDHVRFTLELLGSSERAPAAAAPPAQPAGAGADAADAAPAAAAWHPPVVVLQAAGLALVTTDATWRVVDLAAGRATNARAAASAAAPAARAAVYVFRLLTWQALTVTLAPHPRAAAAATVPPAAPVEVLRRLEGCARLTAAKAAAGARTALEVDIVLREAVRRN